MQITSDPFFYLSIISTILALIFAIIAAQKALELRWTRNQRDNGAQDVSLLKDEKEKLKDHWQKTLERQEEEAKKVRKELVQLKQNPDRTITVLNDLMSNKRVILEVRQVPPTEIFLRSPKDIVQ